MGRFATLVLLIGIAAVADDAGPLYIERAAPPSPAEFRWERRGLPGDAELLTLFGGARQPQRAAPILSVLREPDQASSSERDHLRYVWVYGYTRPTWIQRLAAAAPFFYRRAQERQDIGPETPKPILDLKHPARGAWARLLGDGLQHWVLDGAGAPLRLVSRTYRGNA